MKPIARNVLSMFAAALAIAACETTSAPSGGLVAAGMFGPFRSSMSESDRMKAIEVVRSNKTETWKGEGGNEYTVASLATTQGASGECRDYSITGMVDGKKDSYTGKACRQANGTWSGA